MNKYTQIADKIGETYEDNMIFLRPKYQWHYFTRKYRIDNDQIYVQPILASYQLLSLRGFNNLLNIADKDFVSKESHRKLAKWTNKKAKMDARKKLYTRDPEQLYYFLTLRFMFYLKTFYLHDHPKIKDAYDKAVKELRGIDFSKWLFSPEMLEKNPSGSSNYTFYMQFMGVHDYEEQLINSLRDYWEKNKSSDDISFENKVYGHTHFILAASYFYQRLLKKEKFEWALAFFENNFEKIMNMKNADVIAEVGLAFRLCGMSDHEIVTKTSEYLVGIFDEKRGVVPREGMKSSLERLEHRNILAIMLLSSWDKLNLGPNLTVFMREHNREFFLPKKGVFL